MSMIRYMSLLTTCSVFAALISIVWQAFFSLKQLNKVTTILTGLLAIEASLKRPLNAPRPKVAIGYGACTDLLITATEFLNFTQDYANDIDVGREFFDEINDEKELLQSFAYYFKNGAASERLMPNHSLFKKLIITAKTLHRDKIQWLIGGNAPLMSKRFYDEGADVLLGARMSKKLRRLLPTKIQIAGGEINEDDIHIILEYKTGDSWGPYTAPRANRYIVHYDKNNAHLNSIEEFGEALRDFKPTLLIISGLQMMDSYKFKDGVRETRLRKVQKQICSQSPTTLRHFEMASYVEIELLQLLRRTVLPYVDSIGMNEQELENLRHVIEYGRTTLASNSNPRVAATLDQMRKVFTILAQEYHANVTDTLNRRLVSRIHLHTLAFQALLTVKQSPWKNSKVAAAKAALTAHRYVCQSNMINPESAALVLDDSFASSIDSTAQRIEFNPRNPVPCWVEDIKISPKKSYEIEICVAPVLVCRIAKKTAGAGDNISAASIVQQI